MLALIAMVLAWDCTDLATGEVEKIQAWAQIRDLPGWQPDIVKISCDVQVVWHLRGELQPTLRTSSSCPPSAPQPPQPNPPPFPSPDIAPNPSQVPHPPSGMPPPPAPLEFPQRTAPVCYWRYFANPKGMLLSGAITKGNSAAILAMLIAIPSFVSLSFAVCTWPMWQMLCGHLVHTAVKKGRISRQMSPEVELTNA